MFMYLQLKLNNEVSVVHEGVRARLKSRRPTDGAPKIKHGEYKTETSFKENKWPLLVRIRTDTVLRVPSGRAGPAAPGCGVVFR
jgi:hypothetical protein